MGLLIIIALILLTVYTGVMELFSITVITPILVDYEYLYEAVITFLWFVIPVIGFTIILMPIRFLTKIPDYIFRKILHITAIGLVTILIVIPTHWWISEIILGICGLGIVAILLVFETLDVYKQLFIEKGKHEVLLSFISFFAVVLILITVFWGLRGDAYKYYVIVALAAWGLGDAAAAIFGHLIGRHKLSGRMIEGVKSVEGSVACFIFATAISFTLLIVLMNTVWWVALLVAFGIGLLVSIAELFTKKGMDNVSCPLVAAIILLFL